MIGAAGSLLAHPLTEPGGLPVPPALAALYAAASVFVVAHLVPRDNHDEARADRRALDPWTGRLTRAETIGRGAGMVVLLTAVLVARLGPESELENIVPALILGVGWPLALLAGTLGASWRWFDPLDGAARLIDRTPLPRAPDDVRWAAVPAAAVAGYVAIPVTALAPRWLGAALAVYAIVMIGGALYMGRAWLRRADAVGLLLTWLPLVGRGRLASWTPPRGADMVLGILTGGLLFGAIRRSALWGDLNTSDGATLLASAGFAGCAALAAVVVTRSEAGVRSRGSAGAVTAAMVPAVASTAIALALARNRFFVSLQLLPALASDPAGLGWDLFGTAGGAIDPNPLGTTGLSLAQAGVLLLGHLAGAFVFARRATPRARPVGASALALSLAAGIMAVAAIGELPPPSS